MVLRLVLLGVKAGLLGAAGLSGVIGGISYWRYTELEDALYRMRCAGAQLREEVARLEGDVASGRTELNGMLERERVLRDRSGELKAEAVELERRWQEVKGYKRRVEECGLELERLRKRIQGSGR
jgi:uncharacterized coiled-coil DUF342 family protein